jgi:hypothetical protein
VFVLVAGRLCNSQPGRLRYAVHEKIDAAKKECRINANP